MYYSDYPKPLLQPIMLTEEEWQEPRNVFTEFFETYDLADFYKMLNRWMHVVPVRRKFPQKRLPETHYMYEQLIRLLEAGYLIKLRSAGILPKDAKWMDTRWWLQPDNLRANEMMYFPRSLNDTEYSNPYKVFALCRKCFTLAEWRNLLEHCWLACFGRGRANISRKHMLRVMRLLPKLVAAVYLIYVRELLPSESTTD